MDEEKEKQDLTTSEGQKSFLASLSEKDRKTLQETINAIKAAKTTDIESLIFLLMKRLLEMMSSEGYEIDADLELLSPEQSEALMKDLDELIEEMTSQGMSSTRKEVIRSIFLSLTKYFESKYDKRIKKKQEYEYDFLNPKQLLELKRAIKQHMMHQFHCFVNPKQLAGETKEENFLSNVILYGKKKAVALAGGEEMVAGKLSGFTVDALKASHKQNNGRGL